MSQLRRHRRYLAAYLMLAPSILLFLFVRVVPLTGTFVLSFFRWSIIQSPVFVGLANFRQLPNDPVFWQSLLHTVLYTLYVVPLSIFLGILLAVVVNRKNPGVSVFRVAYFFPYVTSLVFVGVVWRFMYGGSDGFLNTLLHLFHLPPVPWLDDPNAALASIAVVGIWTVLPFNMIVFLAGLQAIPPSYEESAMLDGANRWTILWRITLPILRPTLFFVTFIGLTRTFQVFDLAYVMTGGGPANGTLTLVYYIYDYGFKYLRFGYASAASVVLFAVIFVVTIVQRRAFEE